MTLTEAEISKKLFPAIFRTGAREIRVLFLLPESLWRPLSARWWRGKEAYLVGGDENGNYILRHGDGSVRLWDHSRRGDEILAPSVRAFVEGLQVPRPDSAA